AEFLRDRARLDVDAEALTALTKRLGDQDPAARARAGAALVRRGPAAVPVLQRAANDLDDPQRADGARRRRQWLQGAKPAAPPAAGVRLLAVRGPPGAVEALLEYLPAAEAPGVVDDVTASLAALAYADGKPHPALLGALRDGTSVRRAVAATALCRQPGADPPPAVRGLLADPSPLVRFRAALAL